MRIAIVIPVLNQLDHTRACVRCLEPDLAAGVRVVIVDNASSDGTGEWLAGREGITVVTNEENRGCAAAWNQGVAAAGEAEWFVVLNNDVLLPAGWLTALISSAGRHGLDIVCPAMREGPQNYDFEAYARRFTARMSGVVRGDDAHGVCFAVRDDVFETVGRFDEEYRIGVFEDTDFFRRARSAGFRLGVVGDAFIHHFGSVTQKAIRGREKTPAYEAANRIYYRRKWNLGWTRRRWERARYKLRAWRWRTTERIRFGHTLHEQWRNGRVRFR